jgi:tetratricopeptide (TPR) repeat protein
LEEELIHQLAANPELHVIARTSSNRFGDSALSIREISERLDIRYVIEGSVRETQDGMRITVQLIDAETDAHIWSRVFDAGEVNLVRVQEQVGEAVSRLLTEGGSHAKAPAVAEDLRATPSRHPVPDAAYRLYLLGEAHMRVGTPNGYVRASEYYSDALRIAPSYALAWSRQAAAYLLRYQFADLPLEEAASLAERALERALEIDPGQAEALATFGLMYTYLKDYPQAERYFERALERQPNLRFALHNYGFALWSQANYAAALVPLRKALTIDPLSGRVHFLVADSLAGLGEFDVSVAQYQRCMEMLPELHTCALGLSTLQRLIGDHERARESLELAATLTDEGNFWQLLSSGLLALQMNELEAAGTYLDRAAEIRPRDYVLLRGQLHLSLATGTFAAFLDRLEEHVSVDAADREIALIRGLAYFHADDCAGALESYRPHRAEIQPYLGNIWDAESGFSHALALAYCSGQLGDEERREHILARLGAWVESFPESPIPAQRFLAAAHYKLSGEDRLAQQELDHLRDTEWPAYEVIKENPVFR